jgi:hypothetical protein
MGYSPSGLFGYTHIVGRVRRRPGAIRACHWPISGLLKLLRCPGWHPFERCRIEIESGLAGEDVRDFALTSFVPSAWEAIEAKTKTGNPRCPMRQ